jgi:hypothetical protein
MKFNIDDYKGKYVMHCKTEEEANDFLDYLDSIGKKWCSGRSYLCNTCWHYYTTDTIYNFNTDSYCDIKCAKQHHYTILEWSDFMNKEFTKADLKTGDVVQRRNGSVEIVNCELKTLICKRGWNDLDDTREDLTDKQHSDYDIVAVRRPKEKGDCQFDAFGCKHGTLVYERKEVEEMTLAEVCKLLGKEIKIIK